MIYNIFLTLTASIGVLMFVTAPIICERGRIIISFSGGLLYFATVIALQHQ